MLYLEKPRHIFHPFSGFGNLTDFMITGDFMFAWDDVPIRFSPEKECFIVRRYHDGSWQWDDENEFLSELELDPARIWFKCREVNDYVKPMIQLKSYYVWTANSFVERKEVSRINYQPKILSGSSLDRFNLISQLFNEKIDISHFEQWCVSYLGLEGFTVKTNGPLNLLQFKSFKTDEASDESKRVYEDSTLELFIKSLLCMGQSMHSKGVYGEPNHPSLWPSEEHWCNDD